MESLIQHLNDSNFSDSVEKDHTPILVDFWAEWCMPCRALAPVIEELAQEFQGKIRFAKVNTDQYQEIASRFRVRGIPTLILFHEGKKVNELVGNQSKDRIRTMLSTVAAHEG